MTEKKPKLIERVLRRIYAVVTHKRMKALYWSSGCMLAVAFASQVSAELSVVDPTGWQTVFAGLILAQLTKALNNSLSHQSQ